jgi:hypothetical protein
MKNLIIAILATIIFYTQFCVIKMPLVMPVFTLSVWMIIAEIDEIISDYKKSVKRGEKLQRSIRRVV